MPRGLGKQHRHDKDMLHRAFDAKIGALTFAHIRGVEIMNLGGDPERDKLNPSHERSLKRALKRLVDRGDVLIAGGKGGVADPYRYITIEAFAGVAEGRKVDTAEARKIVAELSEAVAGIKDKLATMDVGR